jgi:hypothetical protein
MKDAPCGVYVGTVNFKIGDKTATGSTVGNRLKVFLKHDKGQITKWHENIPWN